MREQSSRSTDAPVIQRDALLGARRAKPDGLRRDFPGRGRHSPPLGPGRGRHSPPLGPGRGRHSPPLGPGRGRHSPPLGLTDSLARESRLTLALACAGLLYAHWNHADIAREVANEIAATRPLAAARGCPAAGIPRVAAGIAPAADIGEAAPTAGARCRPGAAVECAAAAVVDRVAVLVLRAARRGHALGGRGHRPTARDRALGADEEGRAPRCDHSKRSDNAHVSFNGWMQDACERFPVRGPDRVAQIDERKS
jgi:hypothetical protein